jgi:hypothetical protein
MCQVFVEKYPKIKYTIFDSFTWGNASHRQTTDFAPGYIAERCREELLDLAGMMTSPTQ